MKDLKQCPPIEEKIQRFYFSNHKELPINKDSRITDMSLWGNLDKKRK